MGKRIVLVLVVVIGFFAIWECLAAINPRTEIFTSRPSEIFPRWWSEVFNLSYWIDFGFTSGSLLIGYSISVVLGYFFGAFGYFLKTRNIDLNLIFLILGSIPVFAIAPLLILALGSGLSTRVAVVVLSSVFLIASSVYQAMKLADEEYGSIFRDLKASHSKMWSVVLLPAGIYYAIPSLKGAVALSLIGVFVAEWISSEAGLGKYILSAMSLYDAERLMVGIFSFMLLSTVIMLIISLLEISTIKWRNFR